MPHDRGPAPIRASSSRGAPSLGGGPGPSRDDRAARALLFALALAGGGALVLLWLAPPQSYPIPPCPFHALTGLFCPGCGTLRALHALLHLELGTAFGFNPLTVLLLPYLAIHGIAALAWALGLRARPRLAASAPGGGALLALVLVFWLARNLPFAAFDPLRPGPLGGGWLGF